MYFFQKLNGWQRLYAVLVAFFYLPVVFLVAQDMVPPVPSIEEIVSRLPNGSKDLTKGNVISLSYTPEAKGHFSGNLATGKIDWEKVIVADKEYKIYETVEFLLSERYGFGWDFQMDVLEKIPDSKLNGLGSEIYQAIVSAHASAITVMYLQLAAKALIVALMVYLFGYAVGWVYVGFRGGK